MAEAGGIRAGRAFVELAVQDKLKKGLEAARKHLAAWGEAITAAGLKLTGIGLAAVGGFTAAGKVFADLGDSLDEMSSRTGVSVEALSELSLAAELSGAGLNGLESGIRLMQKNLNAAASGSDGAAKAFTDLGLSIEQLKNLSPDRQFELIADRLSAIRDPAQRAGAAMEVFGKSGTKLLPMLEGGAQGLREARKQARELGLTMSGESAKDAARLADSMDILAKVVRHAVAAVGAALAPTISAVADTITRVVGRIATWVKQNKAVVVTFAKVATGVLAAGAALVALGYLFTGLSAVIGGVMTVVSALVAVLGAIVSPIGLAVAAIAGLAGALVYFTGTGGSAVAWLGQRFGQLWGWVSEVVTGISDALAGGEIGMAAKVLWLGLKVAWEAGIGALNRAWLEGKRWFLSQFYQMWSGAQSAVEFGWHGIKVGWVETTSFLSRTWERFTSGLAKAWEWFSRWFAVQWATIKNIATKAWNSIKSLWDEGFDANAANEAADQALVAAEQNIEQMRDANLARINSEHSTTMDALEKERQARRDAEQKRHEERLRGINDAEDQNLAALDKQTSERLARSRDDLNAAQAELQTALARAREKRGTFADAAGPGSPDAKKYDIAGIGAAVEKKISVVGTFNAVAAGGLAAGGTAAERTAKATEETARHTKRLVERSNTGAKFT